MPIESPRRSLCKIHRSPDADADATTGRAAADSPTPPRGVELGISLDEVRTRVIRSATCTAIPVREVTAGLFQYVSLLRMSRWKCTNDAYELFLRGGRRTMAAWQFGTLGQWEVCCEKVVDATMKRYCVGPGHDENRPAKASQTSNVICMTRNYGQPAKR